MKTDVWKRGSNTREGKRSEQHNTHNRQPGTARALRVLGHRKSRRRFNRYNREVVKVREFKEV